MQFQLHNKHFNYKAELLQEDATVKTNICSFIQDTAGYLQDSVTVSKVCSSVLFGSEGAQLREIMQVLHILISSAAKKNNCI